jgi:hypothetical protein
MTEPTPAQRDLLDRITPVLGEAFGERVLIAPDQPSLFVRRGSIGVRLDVTDAPGGDAVLECYAWIAQGLPITPGLGLYLAQRNVELHFGALAIDGEGAIMLQHSLFAESVSDDVLIRLVRVLTDTADVLDADVRARFGGAAL